MYEFQDLTPNSGHFRTNFEISGISGQCPGLNFDMHCLTAVCAFKINTIIVKLLDQTVTAMLLADRTRRTLPSSHTVRTTTTSVFRP